MLFSSILCIRFSSPSKGIVKELINLIKKEEKRL